MESGCLSGDIIVILPQYSRIKISKTSYLGQEEEGKMNKSLGMFHCRREIRSIYKSLYLSQWKGREQTYMSPQFSAPAAHHHSNGLSTPPCSQTFGCRLCLLHRLWSNHYQYRCRLWLFLQLSI